MLMRQQVAVKKRSRKDAYTEPARNVKQSRARQGSIWKYGNKILCLSGHSPAGHCENLRVCFGKLNARYSSHSEAGFFYFMERIFELRLKAAEDYCAFKGWDVNTLSIEQVLEIRSLPEWKDPIQYATKEEDKKEFPLSMILILFSIFVASLASCAPSPTKYHPQAADTLKTLAVYESDSHRVIDAVYRVTKDTANLHTSPISAGRDTAYYVPKFLPLFDSLHRPVMDTLGHQRTELTWVPGKVIRDFNVNIDSLLNAKP